MSASKGKAASQVRRKQFSFLVNEREHAALARKARAARVSAGEYIRSTCGLSASKHNTGAGGGSPEPVVLSTVHTRTIEQPTPAELELIERNTPSWVDNADGAQASAERILSQASTAQASAMDSPTYDPVMSEKLMLAEIERIENDERIEAIEEQMQASTEVSL